MNECEDSKACADNAVCVDEVGSYSCICAQGYTGDGRTYCSGAVVFSYTTLFHYIFEIENL